MQRRQAAAGLIAARFPSFSQLRIAANSTCFWSGRSIA